MKAHTNGFKTNIKLLGREIDSKITYTLNNEDIELGNEDLNSVSPHYEGGILKSVMKQLDIDSNVDIPIGTEINYQFGLKVGNSYEYLDFGNYIVYSSERQEDTRSWKIVAYDKMLYAMKDYENVEYTFPMTIREYIGTICNTLELDFANANGYFANYDKTISQDMFLDVNGASLGYTYRDVLDQLAEATASTICINDDDELEIRYVKPVGQENEIEGTSIHIENAMQDGILYNGVNNITQTNNDLPFVIDLTYVEDTEGIDEEYLKDINVNFGEKYGPVNSIVLSRSAGADNIYLRDETSVIQNGLCEIKIEDNQLMNDNDRANYLPDILGVLSGFEYYINDFSSTGITYYELCDKYNVTIDNNVYTCVMLNDEINITQGIEELIHTDMPETSETDYTKSDKTDRKINQAYSIVDKQNQTITNFVSQTTQTQQLNEQRLLQLETTTNSVQQQLTSTQATIEVMQQDIIDGQETLKNSLVTIDINGINVSTNASKISTLMTNEKFVIKSGDTYLAFFGYDDEIGQTKAEMDNLTVTNYFVSGYHRVEKMEIDGEYRTGWFYMGGNI